VVFVPFTAPGDRVRIRVDSRRARFLHGRVEELLTPSPVRTDPVCAVFGSCGGCAWQHVEYAAQLEAKAKIVGDAFQRIGGVPLKAKVPITASTEPYGYRSRARILVGDGRVGFRHRRSHSVCATAHCPVLTLPLQKELAGLAEQPPRRGGEWELFVGDGEVRALALKAKGGDKTSVKVGDDCFVVSPGVFVQANALFHQTLTDAVLTAAGSGDLACDFFAGIGFFTLGLARQFARVIAVESNRFAVDDLDVNLRTAGLTNVTIMGERLETLLLDEQLAGERPQVVLLDPPRTGLPPGSADALAELAADRIVYLSCDPATQARDVRNLVGNGYALESIEAFDLFPQTPHVECLAVLERR